MLDAVRAGHGSRRVELSGRHAAGRLGLALNGLLDDLDGARQQVEAREARLDLALEASGAGLWDWDIRADRISHAPPWCRRLGLDESAGQTLEGYSRLLHPEDRDAVLQRRNAALAGDGVYLSRHRLLDAAGRFIWVEERGRVLAWDANRLALSMVGSLRDISEQQADEQAWIEDNAELRAMTEAAPVILWLSDAAGDCIAINPRWYQFTGQAPEAALGRGWVECIHPDDYLWLIQGALQARQPFQLEFRVRRHDGAWRWLLVSAAPRHCAAGEFAGFTGAVIDVHERFEQAQAQTAGAERAALFMEHVPDAMLVTDQDGRILRLNGRAEAMFGYPREALLGQPVEVLVPEAQRQRHAELRTGYLSQAVPRPMGTASGLTAVRQDGECFPVDIRLVPVVVGEATEMIVSVRDLSERRAMEALIEQLHERLEERVAERSVELLQARDDALRQLQVKNDLLANLSYGIRTQLSIVLGLASIGVRVEPDSHAAASCRRILAAGDHLLRVLGDLGGQWQIEPGHAALQAVPFRLDALLEQVIDSVVAPAQRKGLSYSLRRAADLPEWVEGDALRVELILANLMANAVKFTEQGEVRLCVARDGAGLCFMVLDSGIGMSPAQLARLGPDTPTTPAEAAPDSAGSGFGLAIIGNLVRHMRGELNVLSAPGAGTAFLVQLPLGEVAAPAGLPEPERALSGTRLDGLRVLAVEDVELNRLILADIFRQVGASGSFAENGLQAVECIERDPEAYDVVLMDIQMPVMDGFTATRRIRAIAPQLPVIGLTAHALSEERQQCLAAGMVDHLAKPIDPADLVAAMRHWARTVEVPPAPASGASLPARRTPPASGTALDWSALLAFLGGRDEIMAMLSRKAVTDPHAAETGQRAFHQHYHPLERPSLADDLRTLAASLPGHAPGRRASDSAGDDPLANPVRPATLAAALRRMKRDSH
jgi:PAS domain S-box-containing protein